MPQPQTLAATGLASRLSGILTARGITVHPDADDRPPPTPSTAARSPHSQPPPNASRPATATPSPTTPRSPPGSSGSGATPGPARGTPA